jgi:hypothetical protein
MEPKFILLTAVGTIVFLGLTCILLSLVEKDKYEHDEITASFVPSPDSQKTLDEEDFTVEYSNIDNDFYSPDL